MNIWGIIFAYLLVGVLVTTAWIVIILICIRVFGADQMIEDLAIDKLKLLLHTTTKGVIIFMISILIVLYPFAITYTIMHWDEL